MLAVEWGDVARALEEVENAGLLNLDEEEFERAVDILCLNLDCTDEEG